ncbi:MAG: serine/threonine protein kinase [Chthoniobacterales bacterium]
MLDEHEQHVTEIVKAALDCAPAARAEFLAQECRGDNALRLEVEELLGQENDLGDFLEAPALHQFAETLASDGTGMVGSVIGDYEILALIASGGMGEVYLARDRDLQRKVALKLIRGGWQSPGMARHFKREELLLARLNHPNIAQLYDGGLTAAGFPFFAMEYVEGERLDEYCQLRRLPTSERLRLFRKICGAVAYAHQHLVLHRDIKPGNIRVTPEGEPKLFDFGIAKLLEGEGEDAPGGDHTMTIASAMTPDYASPEQVRGESLTTASDVYSLGVLLYEMLTGERPYRLTTRNAGEISRAITEHEPVRPSFRLREIDPDLDNIILMALRKEPARRYPSVASFAEDVRRYSEGLPVTARKDTVRYRTAKFFQRNKAGMAAAALVALALFGGLVVTSWQMRIARKERDRARVAQSKAEQARQQTELAKTQADRLNHFLENLLGSADPARMGKELKVILDAAAQRIDVDLANEPEVLAQVHETLGRTYERLKIPPTRNNTPARRWRSSAGGTARTLFRWRVRNFSSVRSWPASINCRRPSRCCGMRSRSNGCRRRPTISNWRKACACWATRSRARGVPRRPPRCSRKRFRSCARRGARTAWSTCRFCTARRTRNTWRPRLRPCKTESPISRAPSPRIET